MLLLLLLPIMIAYTFILLVEIVTFFYQITIFYIILVKLSGVNKGRHVTMKYFSLLIDRKIIGMFSNHFM